MSSRAEAARSSLKRVVVEQSRQRHPAARARWGAAALPALAVTAVVVVALGWIDPSVLCMVPVLALSLLLSLRRYPGEKVLVRLRSSAQRRLRGPRQLACRERIRPMLMPRGGLLLACALAVRPPPGALRAAG